MKILITGCAGFIGFHLCYKILELTKHQVYGIDNLNNYYDNKLKKKRLSILKKKSNNLFTFKKIDLCEIKKLNNFSTKNKIEIIINLAAQAGVRHSINNSKAYFDSNLSGFFNLIEIAKKNKVKHFIFASTSSVYGNQKTFPTTEDSNTDKPQSFYAASKKCNEIMAYSYSNIFKLPCTGLRFFTVYGPYGRPDMALYKFVKGIDENKTIYLYNNGRHIRDFTYIDDVVAYMIDIIPRPPKGKIPFNIFNIGSNKPKSLHFFVNLIQKIIKKKIKFKKIQMQKGDVYKTHANNAKIIKYLKKNHYTGIENGINKFISWYRKYK